MKNKKIPISSPFALLKSQFTHSIKPQWYILHIYCISLIKFENISQCMRVKLPKIGEKAKSKNFKKSISCPFPSQNSCKF